jgi:hypothetical protein
MTVERGATPSEAATAAEMRTRLEASLPAEQTWYPAHTHRLAAKQRGGRPRKTRPVTMPEVGKGNKKAE